MGSPSAWTARVPGTTTSSSSGSGDRSSTRRSTSELTTRSLRPAPRSAGISASTIPADRTRALTGRRRIEPISPGCRRSRRLEPGRGSTYRAGKLFGQTEPALIEDFWHFHGDGIHFWRHAIDPLFPVGLSAYVTGSV